MYVCTLHTWNKRIFSEVLFCMLACSTSEKVHTMSVTQTRDSPLSSKYHDYHHLVPPVLWSSPSQCQFLCWARGIVSTWIAAIQGWTGSSFQCDHGLAYGRQCNYPATTLMTSSQCYCLASWLPVKESSLGLPCGWHDCGGQAHFHACQCQFKHKHLLSFSP